MYIIPQIHALEQYVSLLNNNAEQMRLQQCPHCGRNHPWRHGYYLRQSDRINPSSRSLNAIPIQRYYCPGCKKTTSVLPECIPPHRWYLWVTQAAVLHLLLMGQSIYAVAKSALPSRQTISRWYARLIEQFSFHREALCTIFHALGRATGSIKNFWLTTLKQMFFETAMRLCHVAGVVIP